jgi:hypothetical protein
MSALSAPPAIAVPECFQGPISADRTLPELRSIAGALNLSTTGNKTTIAKRIREYTSIEEHQATLQTDPKFQGLFFYKTGDSKGAHRTSAHKAAEDVAATVLDDHRVTPYVIFIVYRVLTDGFGPSAHATLMNLKISSDPPGQFKRLGSQGGTANGGGEGLQEANAINLEGMYRVRLKRI